MISKTIIFLCLALGVFGDGHHAVSEQRIKIFLKGHTQQPSKEHIGHYGKLAHVGPNEPEHHDEYAWSYPSYEFSYKVHDPYTHDMKGQQETREGDEVKGAYWLIEPNGRKRTVSYTADKHSGFHANVHYSIDHHQEDHGDKKEEQGKEELMEKRKEGVMKEEENTEYSPVKEEPEKEVHYNEDKHNDYKHYDEPKHDKHITSLKHNEKHKDIVSIIISKNHGKHDHHESQDRSNEEDKNEKIKEESRSQSVRREFDDRFARPSYKSATVRDNYYHPQFYRHHKRIVAGQ